jgi:hypothetical protein
MTTLHAVTYVGKVGELVLPRTSCLILVLYVDFFLFRKCFSAQGQRLITFTGWLKPVSHQEPFASTFLSNSRIAFFIAF